MMTRPPPVLHNKIQKLRNVSQILPPVVRGMTATGDKGQQLPAQCPAERSKPKWLECLRSALPKGASQKGSNCLRSALPKGASQSDDDCDNDDDDDDDDDDGDDDDDYDDDWYESSPTGAPPNLSIVPSEVLNRALPCDYTYVFV